MISVIIIRFMNISRVCGLKTGMNIAKNKKPRCNGVLMSERRGFPIHRDDIHVSLISYFSNFQLNPQPAFCFSNLLLPIPF